MDPTSVFAPLVCRGRRASTRGCHCSRAPLLERVDAVDLAAPFDELSSTAGLITLGLLTLFAFVVPVLAILLVIALLAALAVLWRRARRGMGALG
jgi:hypothetical protein